LTGARLVGALLTGADLSADMKNQSMGLMRAVRPMHRPAEARNDARWCVACWDRVRTRGLFRSGSGPQGHSILESHPVHDHKFPDVAGGKRQLGYRPMQE